MSTVIRAKNVSKQYRLGKIGTGTLSHDLNRWWYRIRGKEDPYLKIGESNDRTVKGESEYVWALRDINFDIEQGSATGIIGRNGAGKSTLLKILSHTTAPTTGSVKIMGRVASLLEVGTGFHPELSGRDNTYLNGAILGMTRREITRKFDEIVDFAGVERYIDTPVKRYSSGMYVRLAFAVAAHLESEILVVDEVLAVGDAEFQKKCLGKMGEVSKGEGRTVIYVSHNMESIRELCTSAILLKNGLLVDSGSASDIVSTYLKTEAKFSTLYDSSNWLASGLPHLTRLAEIVSIRNKANQEVFKVSDQIPFDVTIIGKSAYPCTISRISLRVTNNMGTHVLTAHTSVSCSLLQDETRVIPMTLLIPELISGEYWCTLWIGEGDLGNYKCDHFSVEEVLHFAVINDQTHRWFPNWGNFNPKILTRDESSNIGGRAWDKAE
ncbi:MAG: ABC transporter ATP-binding protein [Bacteroidota bacterium]